MKTLTLPVPFRLRRGGELPSVTLAYETWGTLSPAKDNVLLLTTGMSASSHAASTPEQPEKGWWEQMVGPGKAIDTDRYFVVCNNSLGSCFGSTGPASIDPESGRPWRVDFPVLSIEDIASSSRALLRELGIGKVKAVLGASLGGMTSLAYALLYPNDVERLVSISASAAANTFALAYHSVARELVRQDPDWNGGFYTSERPPLRGMAMARKLGKLAFWGIDEWTERFGRKRIQQSDPSGFGFLFEAEAYLDFNAHLFISTFDACCYMYLSRAFDLFNAADYGSSLHDALSRVKAKTLVVGVSTDVLLPHDANAMAHAMRQVGCDVEYVHLESPHGHDAFLVDIGRFTPPVRDFLNRELSR